jgi:hypothetical protein
MIQIATVGDTQEVVKIGLGKILPEKLYIIHTTNERSKKDLTAELKKAKEDKNESYTNFLKIKQYETNAKSLKKEIETDFKIPVELKSVHKFESNQVIESILSIIDKEQKIQRRDKKDFVVNITGGTKAMVAGAACGAYLAQTRMYYVLHPTEARGKELVRELPVPGRAENNSKGKDTRTSAIILSKLRDYDRPCSNKDFLEYLVDNDVKFPFVKKDPKTNREITELRTFEDKPQLLSYHLGKLLNAELIELTSNPNVKSKSTKKDRRQNTIVLTEAGKHYADYPDILGNVL